MIKNLPANAGDMETWIGSLGQEDPLEEKMSTHFSILAWEIPWPEEPGELRFMGTDTSIYKIDNDKDLLRSSGNSTQYSVMTYMGKEPKKGWIDVYV